MTFTVIDKLTGKKPDLEKIALTEEWAKGLVYCDMEGFAVEQDGTLILLDECGAYDVCPEGRFEVCYTDDAEAERDEFQAEHDKLLDYTKQLTGWPVHSVYSALDRMKRERDALAEMLRNTEITLQDHDRAKDKQIAALAAALIDKHKQLIEELKNQCECAGMPFECGACLAREATVSPNLANAHAILRAHDAVVGKAEFDRGWCQAEAEIAAAISTGDYPHLHTGKLWVEKLRQDDAALTAPLVEALNKAKCALEQYSRFDFYLFIQSYEGMQSDPPQKAQEALTAVDKALAPYRKEQPAPSGVAKCP